VLDPPGPLRAGGRPASPPGDEETARASRIPAAPSFQGLKERLEGLFGQNGRAAEHEEDDTADAFEPVPAPRRTASAARARAGATVAARRSETELWALRVLAAAVVAVLLIAFLLILTSIA
jgi:hypothetical protein